MPRIMVSLLPGGLLVVQNQMHLYPSGHPSHPKNTSVKSMAPPATSPRAAHCIASRASQPARAAHCIASRAAHRIANNPRTVQRAARIYNQPAAHRPQRTAHTSHLQLCAHASQYFALVSLVRGTNFSKIQFIYISNCFFAMCS